MKFLVKYQHKDSYYALPPDKRAAITNGAMAYIEKYIKSNHIKDVYMLSTMKGGVSVWELNSSEEAARFAMEYPLFPYIETEITPLIEVDAVVKVLKEMMQAAQKITQ